MLNRSTAVILCLALFAACGDTTSPPNPREESSAALVLGLVPEQNIFEQMERYTPLARYLSGRLDRKVELRVFSTYGDTLDEFATTDIDGAFLGSFVYAVAHVQLDVTPVARPVNVDNTSTYYGMVIARKDSGIRSMQDMRGKRFAFVDRSTTAGYLLPLDYFYESGVENYETFFAESYFAGTHEDAIYDVLDGRADVGAAKSSVLARLVANDPRVGHELSVLGRSPNVPENGLVLRKGLSDSLHGRLKSALLTMHEDPAGREVLRRLDALRFIETTDEDYAAVYRYAKEVRLDLSTYDYGGDANQP